MPTVGSDVLEAYSMHVQKVQIPLACSIVHCVKRIAVNAIARRHARCATRNEDDFQLCQPPAPESHGSLSWA